MYDLKVFLSYSFWAAGAGLDIPVIALFLVFVTFHPTFFWIIVIVIAELVIPSASTLPGKQ